MCSVESLYVELIDCVLSQMTSYDAASAGVPTLAGGEEPPQGQGLTLVHVRAQLEQLQDTFMS